MTKLTVYQVSNTINQLLVREELILNFTGQFHFHVGQDHVDERDHFIIEAERKFENGKSRSERSLRLCVLS